MVEKMHSLKFKFIYSKGKYKSNNTFLKQFFSLIPLNKFLMLVLFQYYITFNLNLGNVDICVYYLFLKLKSILFLLYSFISNVNIIYLFFK